MYSHQTKVRVRYGETDQMGYMYYGNYAELYEVGRVEMLRSLGMTYKSMEEEGIMMPVLEMRCKYLKPALYDDELTIKIILAKMPGVKIHFKYEFFNEANEFIHEGETTLAFIDVKRNRPCMPPLDFQNRIKSFFE
ncbi:MAG TPA: thioesterase family protein [Pedobacter sp.]|jgi:acyl-CoA thioester hydrolase